MNSSVDRKKLAALLAKKKFAEQSGQRPEIIKISRDQPRYQASFAQQRLYFIDQMESGSAHYNMCDNFKVIGAFDEDIAEQAFMAIIARHEVLRTVYHNDEQGCWQYVNEEANFSLERYDLSALDEQIKTGSLNTIMSRFSQYAFNLNQDVMLKAGFIKCAENEGILMCNMHHIASDGWSMRVLISEFNAHYQAIKEGRTSASLPPLPIQYLDYAQWQRSWLQGDVLDQQINYWAEQLSDLPMVHSLPLDQPRGRIASHRGASVETGVSNDVLQSLKALALKEQATLFMVIHACFSLLLSRYSNSDDIVIGTPVANRLQKSLAPLVGFFVNTLILRSNSAENVSFTDYLRHIKTVNTQAQSHQDVPFEMLVERLVPTRDPAISPLFQIMLSMDNNEQVQGSAGNTDLHIEAVEGAQVQAKFDLMLNVVETDNGLNLQWVYNSDLFAPERIAQMGEHLNHLLEAVTHSADQAIQTLPLMGEKQIQHSLADVDSLPDFTPTQLLHERFEHHAKCTPNAIAIRYQNDALTYAQLNQAANQIAHYLREQGIAPDDLIGLCMTRSTNMLIALLGILKAGGAYVPIDPDYPQERISYLLSDAQLSLILSETQVADTLVHSEDVSVFAIDSEANEAKLAQYANTDLARPAASHINQLAYIIYTSGSTGKPKGVMVEHSNVQRLFAASEQYFNFDHNDVFTLFHSVSFDFSVWEIWGPLLHGGTLVIVPEQIARSPKDFYQLVHDNRVTILNQTPTAFNQFMDQDQAQMLKLALRAVVFGGEALNFSQLRGWVARHGDESPHLVNMYGITETTVHVTYRRIYQHDIESGSASLIGAPLDDLAIVLLDQHFQPVPNGAVGEMFVAGAGVSRGYWQRENLTHERFVTLPNLGGRTLYRTGDLARYNIDQELEYLGRADNQVKVRGFRIELGEIERALSDLPQVTASAVIVHKKQGLNTLAGFYVTDQSEVDVHALRAALRNKLPNHMVPHTLVELAEIPLTVNGKVNTRQLEAQLGELTSNEDIEPPSTDMELRIAKAWCAVLELEQVSINDNFFSLGGDSILSIRVISLLNQEGIDISVQDIFNNQTIKELALAAIHSGEVKAHEYVQPYALISPEEKALISAQHDVEDIYPLTSLQTGMVYQSMLTGFTGVYHDLLRDRVRYRWDAALFEKALDILIHSQPILRTGFYLDGERPLQFVNTHYEVPLVFESLQHLDKAEQNSHIEQWIEARKLHRFDWQNGPLFQFKIFLCEEDCFEMIFSFHHAILDGWSRAKLSNSLYQIYSQLLRGESLEKSNVNWCFKEFVALEANSLADDKAAAFFAEDLENVPTSQIPANNLASYSSFKNTHSVDAFDAHAAKVLDLSEQLGVPVQAVLMAGHLKVLSVISGYEHVVSCTVANGRPELAEAEESFGLYLNTLPISGQCGQGSWRDLISQIATRLTQSNEYRRFPLANIQRLVDKEFGEVLFNYTHFHVMEEVANNTQQTDSNEQEMQLEQSSFFEETTFKFQVNFSRGVGELSRTIDLQLSYVDELYTDETIARMASLYDQVFDHMLRDLEVAHNQVCLLSQEDETHILKWNETNVPFSDERCIHHLIEDVIDNSPSDIAVKFDNTTLSYEQLEQQANAIANSLIAQGVKPETLVGIHLERSEKMVVAILGVLKAGAAYVPLEPEYPQKRIDKIITTANLKIVITQSSSVTELPEVQSLSVELLAQASNIARPKVDIGASNLAYVIFTSGSTGEPKGVMVEHKSLVNRIEWGQKTYPITKEDKLLQKTPFSFDVSVWEFMWPLCFGAQMIVAKPQGHKDPAYLLSLVVSEQITTLHFVPSMLKSILQFEWPQQNSVRQVFCSGELLDIETINQFYQCVGRVPLYNLYGPTEATIEVSAWACPKNPTCSSIGYPIQNTGLYIVNQGNVAPIGTAGELMITGTPLARGYINQLELTQASFVTGEQGIIAGRRLYRTGDLARWLEDGSIEYLGRIDDQVKVRGFRVELGEIEAVLLNHPSVISAAVIAKKVAGSEHLIGFIMASSEQDESILKSELIKELSAYLPAYMVPDNLVVLDEFPLTISGKTDRKALANYDVLHGEVCEPANELEQKVRAIWSAVLEQGEDTISTDIAFFSLGGHSLLLIQLLNRLQSEYQIELGMAEIAEAQTVAAQAHLISDKIAKSNVRIDDDYEAAEDDVELLI